MPVIGGGVVRRDLIRKIPGIVFGAVRADILNDMVDGLDVGHIVDGVAQQQGGVHDLADFPAFDNQGGLYTFLYGNQMVVYGTYGQQ